MKTTYKNTNMIQPEGDHEMPGLVARFEGNASMEEGVSGQELIDTTFENTHVTTLESGNTIHDIKRWKYPHREY
jgi:hypothetical protein